jgi:protein involved in polysaccharide export with SLBB domain
LKAPLPDTLDLNTTEVKKAKDAEARLAKNKEPIGLNTFQTYLLQTIGKTVPIYGQKLFQIDNPYATIETTNIPIDYVLGPGDELQVKIYSSAIDLDQRFVINRDGMIVLPKLGPLALAGVRVGDVENHLKNRLSQSLTDFNVYVSMGQLRGIEVYLTGQARIPGKHNLSSVSTLISALFATGGPASNGSMREIQLLRGGKQVGSIDLYEFIQKGNKGVDIRLLPGDVIHIPSIGPQVALMGAIPTPAIFELPRKKMSSIDDVLSLAGGLTAFTNTFEAFLERVDTTKSTALSVQSIQLDANGLKTILRDGDILNLQAVKPSFSNAISLRILNAPVKRLPIPKENARITDIIPSKESLLTADHFYRRFNFGIDQMASGELLYPNNLVLRSDFERIKDNALLDQINFENVTIERIEADTLKSQLISFNLERAIANPHSNDNIQLFPGDTITIFNQKDVLVPLDRQMRVVRIQGEVNAPGIYQTNGSETLRDVIKKAGGFTSNAYLYGTELTRQSIKQTQKKNLETVIKRLEDQASLELRQSSTHLQTDQAALQALRTQNQVRLRERITLLRNAIPTGRLALELDPKRSQLPDITLENGDEVLIPSTPSSVAVLGAVYNESALLYRPGRSVAEYLKSAGVNQNADREAIFVVRADGTLQSPDLDTVFFKTKLDKVDLNPGDTIVVPEKIISESGYSAFMRGLKDWTQVLFQLGLSAAAIKVIK